MKPTDKGSAAVSDEAGRDHERSLQGLHGVRYQSTDVERAADFYTKYLGFKLEHQQLPAFATVSLGSFKLLLSGPGASGSRPMPDGRRQEAGGWNRIVLHVTDVAREIERLEQSGLTFRNEMETGPGWPKDSARGSRWESDRALRAGTAPVTCLRKGSVSSCSPRRHCAMVAMSNRAILADRLEVYRLEVQGERRDAGRWTAAPRWRWSG